MPQQALPVCLLTQTIEDPPGHVGFSKHRAPGDWAGTHRALRSLQQDESQLDGERLALQTPTSGGHRDVKHSDGQLLVMGAMLCRSSSIQHLHPVVPVSCHHHQGAQVEPGLQAFSPRALRS